MNRLSDFSEVYFASSEASTGEWFSGGSNAVCTKFEVLFDTPECNDYLSNLSVLTYTVADAGKRSVRLSNNNTIFSEWDRIEDSLADYSSARDLLYYWEKHAKGRFASVFIVYFVEKNFSRMNLDVINSLLLTASPHRLTEWSMVALLRASYSAKHLLPGWLVFFEGVKKELKDNERAPKLLAGLDL
ncbi:hypothetical protein HU749_006735 [Pseudomonas ogarae]|uniref:hypothetical protein n=1 Tax=Pseudomonas ogarae (strain DSM 112162 / CECT 30235 / F113) TaxID=1114970 RepID=UPI0016461DE4|nr:hypothetical protein [Pseudomonas zarinae]QXH96077.1 hypothetical protein HU749_006735 [Pseudomonas zarinae]